MLLQTEKICSSGDMPSPSCTVCQGQEEDAFHCLFMCAHAKDTPPEVFPTTPTPPSCILNWLFTLHHADTPFDTLSCIAILWCIWKARNEKIFRNKTPTPNTTILLDNRLVADWRNGTTHPTRPSTSAP